MLKTSIFFSSLLLIVSFHVNAKTSDSGAICNGGSKGSNTCSLPDGCRGVLSQAGMDMQYCYTPDLCINLKAGTYFCRPKTAP